MQETFNSYDKAQAIVEDKFKEEFLKSPYQLFTGVNEELSEKTAKKVYYGIVKRF